VLLELGGRLCGAAEALLAAAERDNFLIVEDDYEFEMSFLNNAFNKIQQLLGAPVIV
jgi:DNA-binding transcriptional MocR family regulator